MITRQTELEKLRVGAVRLVTDHDASEDQLTFEWHYNDINIEIEQL